MDPTHESQFYIKYYDDRRYLEQLTLRCLDRPRDVWVDLLHRMATRLHDKRSSMRSGVPRKKERPEKRPRLRTMA